MTTMLRLVLIVLLSVSTAAAQSSFSAACGAGQAATWAGNAWTCMPAGSGVLGRLVGANFNVTTDQAITITASKYVVRKIVVTNASASLTLAAGGFYTATSKGGTAIVAAIQVYTALTGSTKYLEATLQNLTTDVLTAGTLYLSLTAAQGGTATADVYILGDALP